MNLLSRRSVLAIAAVVDVALHCAKAPVAAKALAARHKLPARHLETLLQGLVHAKILTGVRGPRGGYELARERQRITLGEIVRVAMSLSRADPEDMGATLGAPRARNRSSRAQGGRNLSRQSRFDHRPTDVRDGREVARARRREGQRRFRHLTQLFATFYGLCVTNSAGPCLMGAKL